MRIKVVVRFMAKTVKTTKKTRSRKKPAKPSKTKKAPARKAPAKNKKVARLASELKRVKEEELLDVSRDWKKHSVDRHEIPEIRVPKEKHIPSASLPSKRQAGRTGEYEVYKQRTEQDKRLMMWAGVSFFMVVILLVWILNLKNTFKTIEANNINAPNLEWSEITDNFSQTMDEVKKGLAELKEGAGTTTPNVLPESEDTATSTGDDIKELQKRLKDLEEKLDSVQVDLEN